MEVQETTEAGASRTRHDGGDVPANEAPKQQTPLPIRWSDLPNKAQLLLLALTRLSEPLSSTSLLPYIYPLTLSALSSSSSTTPTPSPSTISLYSGLLAATFPLSQFAASLPCGHLSDHHGRRPAILTGLFISALSDAAFAFSTTLPTLFLWRAIAGLANANVAVMRTATAEVVSDRRMQARAFLLLPLVFNSGMVASLALGGVLADPVVSLPWLFGPGGMMDWGGGGVTWMVEYPFALPALLNAFVLGVAWVLALFGLRETLTGKEGERDWGVEAGKRVVGFVKGVIFRRKEARYKRLDDMEDPGQPDEEDIQLDETKPSVVSSAAAAAAAPMATKPKPTLPFRQIWTRRTVAAMVSFGLLPLHNSAFMHILPVYLSTPPTLNFTGGLGLPPSTIGLSLSLLGLTGILFQLHIYPRWQARTGTLSIFRTSLLIFPAVYALAPLLSVIPAGTFSSWAVLAAVVWGQVMARTMAIPSTVILLTEAAPAKGVLGTVHGAGNMLSSLARAVGPALGGWVYACGVREGMVGAVWWFYLVVVALVALGWCFGVQKEERADEDVGSRRY